MGSGCAVEGLNESSHLRPPFWPLSRRYPPINNGCRALRLDFAETTKWFRGQFIGFDGMKSVHGFLLPEAQLSQWQCREHRHRSSSWTLRAVWLGTRCRNRQRVGNTRPVLTIHSVRPHRRANTSHGRRFLNVIRSQTRRSPRATEDRAHLRDQQPVRSPARRSSIPLQLPLSPMCLFAIRIEFPTR